jgi:membrane-associated HD superfamily phosphohydrolase
LESNVKRVNNNFEQKPIKKEDDVALDEAIAGETEHETLARLRSDKSNCLVKFFYKLVTHHFFNFIIFCLIIFNTVVLASDDYPQSKEKQRVMLYLNVFFTWVFVLELILKVVGLGIVNYFKDSFNCFDASVVLFSLVDYTIDLTIDPTKIGPAAEAIQALKAIRLLRAIKLMRSWTAL